MPEADHNSQLQLMVQVSMVHLTMRFPEYHEVSRGVIARWFMGALQHTQHQQRELPANDIYGGDSKPLARP
jgi:hypothetical protein